MFFIINLLIYNIFLSNNFVNLPLRCPAIALNGSGLGVVGDFSTTLDTKQTVQI
jgi:hypothetical protein